MGWRDHLEAPLRARRARRATAALAQHAEELEGSMDGARGLRLPGSPPAFARVEVDGAEIVLRVRASLDPAGLIRLRSPLSAIGEGLLEDPRIATLLRDAASVDLALSYDNDGLALSGPVEPLTVFRLRDAAILATKLANRLPVVARELVGVRAAYAPPDVDPWIALARDWGLDTGDSTRALVGIRHGLTIALEATPAGTRIRIDAPAEGLDLIARHPSDALEDHDMPLRGGFGPLYVRVGSDAISKRAAESETLPPLAERVGHPFELRWDPDGLTLEVAGHLAAALRPTAEQVLEVARALAGRRRGSPYR